MFIGALIIAGFGTFFLFTDDELLILSACWCSHIIACLFFLFIGLINLPKREKKQDNYKHKFMYINNGLIDLTAMFGKGNEPETKEELEKLFSKNYYDYNKGEKQ